MHSIRFSSPASLWKEAHPIGNGRIGAMVYSGVQEDRIQLNEESLFSGYPNKNADVAYAETVAAAKALVAAGRLIEAEKLLESEDARECESFLPFGDLYLSLKTTSARYTDYTRTLEMREAVVFSHFQADGVRFTRECFTSFADDVLVYRITADRADRVSLGVHFAPSLASTVRSEGRDTLVITGRCPTSVLRSGEILYEDGKASIPFEARVRIIAEHCVTNGGRIEASGQEATLLFSIATGYNGMDKSPVREEKDYARLCRETLEKAASLSYAELRRRHVASYAGLYGRMELSLGESEETTDLLLRRAQEGDCPPALVALLFHFGRYLTLAASRKGLPIPLQGLWNENILPPWRAAYTLNINTEMNYWGTEAVGLPECHMPLFDFLLALSRGEGRRVARELFGAQGFALCHNTDPWGFAVPASRNVRWAFWPMGGVWLSRHIFEHYLHTGDRDFLLTYFPVLDSAVDFLLSYFIEKDGRLLPPMSTSPENAFEKDGRVICLAPYSTMDIALAHDCLTNARRAKAVLGLDDAREARALAMLPPYTVGKDGRLLEWDQEYKESEKGHRHLSHLFGVYPGESIKEGTPIWEAAKRSLLFRIENGGGHTGWSNAWILNLFARFGDAAMCERYIRLRLTKNTMPNLFDTHPLGFDGVFQIDGNLGFVSGICEMLVHGDGERTTLLPALPAAWKRGRVSRIRAKGGLTLSFAWECGLITSLTVEKNDRILRNEEGVSLPVPYTLPQQ